MKQIGLLSDTHSYWDERFNQYFADCDEIWHAGDIGSLEVIERLSKIGPVRAVVATLTVRTTRTVFPEVNRFTIENTTVLMKHIGGYPGKYDKSVKHLLLEEPPQLFISGHSHILKVLFDKKLNLLHINPGAAGKYGFHTIRTIVRFKIDNGNFTDLEVIELSDK